MRLQETTSSSTETDAAARTTREALADARVVGAAIVYRLYDVGYEILLDRASNLLASSTPERARPAHDEHPPVRAHHRPDADPDPPHVDMISPRAPHTYARRM